MTLGKIVNVGNKSFSPYDELKLKIHGDCDSIANPWGYILYNVFVEVNDKLSDIVILNNINK